MSETEDSDVPTILPILRISSHQGTKQQRRDSQKEVKGKIMNFRLIRSQNIKTSIAVTPETQNGKICYDDVLHLLTCPTCESHVSTPVIQCKRGHLSCEDCSRQQQECPICHQSWMDGPNVILDKIINLIALPCKYGWDFIDHAVLKLQCDNSGSMAVLSSQFRARDWSIKQFVTSDQSTVHILHTDAAWSWLSR